MCQINQAKRGLVGETERGDRGEKDEHRTSNVQHRILNEKKKQRSEGRAESGERSDSLRGVGPYGPEAINQQSSIINSKRSEGRGRRTEGRGRAFALFALCFLDWGGVWRPRGRPGGGFLR